MSGWGNALASATRRFRDRSAEEIDALTSALMADANAASKLRSYQQDPNVAALDIERSRDRLDRWGWLFIIGGLLYTTVNVTLFVLGDQAKDAAGKPLGWDWYQFGPAALVEPMMMGLLIVLLRGEQIAGRFSDTTGPWPRWTRWTALAFTYSMNTAASWIALDLAGIFKHSVPVVLVFMGAEALAAQRAVLTRVAIKAAMVPEGPTVPIFVPAPAKPPVLPKLPVPPPPADEPEPPKERPKTNGSRAGRPRGKNRLALEKAYRKLREEMSAEAIGPALLDREAKVPTGTAKKVLKDIVTEYELDRMQEEVSAGGDV